MTEELTIGRRPVRITHSDRVVFPEPKLTKLDLARHYDRVAPAALNSMLWRALKPGRPEPAPIRSAAVTLRLAQPGVSCD